MTTKLSVDHQVKLSVDHQVVREFLSLPVTAMPSAIWADPLDDDSCASAWDHLRDWVRPSKRINHMGEQVTLKADIDGWRDGRVVTLD